MTVLGQLKSDLNFCKPEIGFALIQKCAILQDFTAI